MTISDEISAIYATARDDAAQRTRQLHLEGAEDVDPRWAVINITNAATAEAIQLLAREIDRLSSN
jgi:hypothetical protein